MGLRESMLGSREAIGGSRCRFKDSNATTIDANDSSQ
jgi:hypothetical protein